MLLEVNARFNLWNRLGAVSGVNLPLIAYRDLTGGAVEPATEYQTRTRWLSFGDDARAFVRDYAPAGDLTTLDWLRSYRGSLVYDVFAWDDPQPFLMHLVHSLRDRVLGPKSMKYAILADVHASIEALTASAPRGRASTTSIACSTSAIPSATTRARTSASR